MSTVNTETTRYDLRFTLDEYDEMIEELLQGKTEKYCDLVLAILANKLKQWQRHSVIVETQQQQDLQSHVMLSMLKRSHKVAAKVDGMVIKMDPNHFQAWVYTAAKFCAFSFTAKCARAHMIPFGVQSDDTLGYFNITREELLEKKKHHDAKKKQLQLFKRMMSIETGGLGDDGEGSLMEIEAPENPIDNVIARCWISSRLKNATNLVVNKKYSAHKILTWVVYQMELKYNNMDRAATTEHMDARFQNMTLDEMLSFAEKEKTLLFDAKLLDEHVDVIRALLDEKENGVRLGERLYRDCYMKGATGKKSISDWLNRWNDLMGKNDI